MNTRLKPASSIKPGQLWLDTEGKRIHAHGGSVFHEDGVYYWYGENKERTVPDSGIWHWGVRAYSSTDLYNWADRGLIIPPVVDDPASPLHPSKMMDRPHIVYNDTTKKYVCWLKIMGQDGFTQSSTVLTADRLLGPYEIVHTDLRPFGMNAGDFDLYIDPTDSAAYYYFEKVHTELICALLTPDYTDVSDEFSSHFPHDGPPATREAPAHFVRGGTHYLITSGTTWYFPNQSEIARAPGPHGPWTVLGDPHPTDTHANSFRSQISSVFEHPFKKDLYIAIADRWLPDIAGDDTETSAAALKAFTDLRHSDEPATSLPQADTSRADYVWLPLRFDGIHPTIDWSDEWSIEDFE